MGIQRRPERREKQEKQAGSVRVPSSSSTSRGGEGEGDDAVNVRWEIVDSTCGMECGGKNSRVWNKIIREHIVKTTTDLPGGE